MEEMIIIPLIFLGLPWIVLHYITKWKTAATITNDDEVLLEELYQLAKRLDERMDTVERLVAHDNEDFKPARLPEHLPERLLADHEDDTVQLRELEQLLKDKKGARR